MWCRVRGSNLAVFVNEAGEIADAFRRCDRRKSIREIKLRITTADQRLAGDTLFVGARGITTIIVAIHASLRRPTGRAIFGRLCVLFGGEAHFPEMLSGTLRAVFGHDAYGEAAYFRGIAEKQFAERPFTRTVIEIEA